MPNHTMTPDTTAAIRDLGQRIDRAKDAVEVLQAQEKMLREEAERLLKENQELRAQLELYRSTR